MYFLNQYNILNQSHNNEQFIKMNKQKSNSINNHMALRKCINFYHERKTSTDKFIHIYDGQYVRNNINKKINNDSTKNHQAQQLMKNYGQLLKRIQIHNEAIQEQMFQEIKKHDFYYEQMIRIIKDRQLKTIQILTEKLQDIKDIFETKVAQIKLKICHLVSSKTPINFDIEKIELEKIKILKVSLVRVQYKGLKEFSQMLNKFCFKLEKDQKENRILKEKSIKKNQYSQLSCQQELVWGIQSKSSVSCSKQNKMKISSVIQQQPQIFQDSMVQCQ